MRQSISYQHRQSGTLINSTLAIASVAIVIPVSIAASALPLVGVMVLFGTIAYLFGSLTVEVRHGRVRFWFGPGLISKSYEISDIVSAEPVRNRWYYGWGVRYTPHGWLYNVSGLEAVELTLKSGKRLRVGTDEPDTLSKAIHQAMENHQAIHI